jgi:hypothetical protein
MDEGASTFGHDDGLEERSVMSVEPKVEICNYPKEQCTIIHRSDSSIYRHCGRKHLQPGGSDQGGLEHEEI